jgi:hypothetical protein
MTKADHLAEGEHHVRDGKLHMAKLKGLLKARGMEDDTDDTDDDEDCELTFLKASIAECAVMAEHHLKCAKVATDDLAKSDLDRADDIRPDGISSIVGEVPQNVHPVFRSGQRDFGKATDGVDAVLAKTIFNDEI